MEAEAPELPTLEREYELESEIGGKEYLTIFQDPSGAWRAGNGATLWDAAIILSKYMEHMGASAFKGKKVLELGSGTGLCGMLACLCESERVALSERPCCIPLLTKNVRANIQGGLDTERCQIRPFQWESKDDQARIAESAGEGGWDVILAADVIYLEEIFDPLVAALDAVASPHTEILLAYEVRKPMQESSFWEKMVAAGFGFDEIDLKGKLPNYASDDLVIVRAQRRAGAVTEVEK